MLYTNRACVNIFSLFPFYHQNYPVGWYENKQEEKGEVKVDSSLWEGLSLATLNSIHLMQGNKE